MSEFRGVRGFNGTTVIQPNTAADVPLTIQPADASQTGNLLEYRNSAGTLLASVSPLGVVKNAAEIKTITAITASGAITPGTAATYCITKAGVAAMTLAAPVAADEGKIITVSSDTAFAHTITATGLLNTGSASVNVATFAAFAGAGVTLMARSLKWNVLASVGITFS